MEAKVQKYPTLQTRLTLTFTILGVLIAGVIILIQYNGFRNALRNELRQRLISLTRIAALQQDGDLLLKVTSGTGEFYNKINSANLKIRDSDPDLRFVYTMRKNEQGIYFVVDANRPGDELVSQFNEPYAEPSQTLIDNFDTLSGTLIEPDFYTDEYGTFLSAYAPIYTSKNDRAGVLGVDITANRVIAKERGFLIDSLRIFLITIPFIALLGAVFGRIFAVPVIQLTKAANKVTEGTLEMDPIPNPGSREFAQLASTLRSMTHKISDLVMTLEQRVEQRTAELAAANLQVSRRASQLEIITKVSETIAGIRDLNTLLPQIARTISDEFGFYHTGIFLLDETKRFAVLSAANSAGGRQMLDRGHRLKVSEQGIVGYVAANGVPRLALDTGADSVFFNNPDLPATRSEIALPLLSGRRVIGVLDVQSDEVFAFRQDDIKVLTALANQVSIAIQNTRLFEETQQSLNEIRSSYGDYLGNIIGRSRTEGRTGYRLSGASITPIEDFVENPEIQVAMQKGEKTVSTGTGKQDAAVITVPIKLRNEIIGVLDVRMPQKRTWSAEEVDIASAVAERVALAVENASLLEDSQRRAVKERAISEITTKISSSINLRNVLQTAVEELGHALPGSDVIIQIQQESPSTGQP